MYRIIHVHVAQVELYATVDKGIPHVANEYDMTTLVAWLVLWARMHTIFVFLDG